jgi:hypothetical protein
MRLFLKLLALGAAFAVLWIAFFHRISLPFGTVATESLSIPLAILCACAAGLAWSYRASLADSLRRAERGSSDESDMRAVRITIGLLVVSGFLLRIARTGEYGLNPDEAQLVWIGASTTPSDVWAYETLVSPHPPGIFYLYHYMLQVSWNLVWLRLPAVLGGTVSIWLSYRLARELMGSRAGVAIAWLVAFSPPLMELSRIARNYAAGFAFIVLALYLFVLFLKTERWKYFAAYTAAATMAVLWHYFFLVVFVGIKVVVAIEFLRRREPFSSWLRVGAIQSVFAAAMMFLYLQHISVLPPNLVNLLDFTYRPKTDIEVSVLLGQFSALWQFLAPGWAGIPLMLLCASGAVVLAAARQWLALSFCTVPLLVALAFSWTSTIPLGGSRHSAHLFPFFFLLVAANASEITTCYRATRSNLASLSESLRWLEPGSSSSLSVAAWGSGAAAVLAAFFAVTSLLDYNGEADRYAFVQPGYHGFELVRRYSQADVDRAFELLTEHAEPADWVLLDFEGSYALRLYLQMPPMLHPSRTDLVERDMAMIVANSIGPQQRKHAGVQYYHAGAFHSGLRNVWKNLNQVKKYYGIELPEKVWLMQGAWSPPFMDRFKLDGARAPIDREVYRESNGMLFGIQTDTLRAFAIVQK